MQHIIAQTGAKVCHLSFSQAHGWPLLQYKNIALCFSFLYCITHSYMHMFLIQHISDFSIRRNRCQSLIIACTTRSGSCFLCIAKTYSFYFDMYFI